MDEHPIVKSCVHANETFIIFSDVNEAKRYKAKAKILGFKVKVKAKNFGLKAIT